MLDASSWTRRAELKDLRQFYFLMPLLPQTCIYCVYSKCARFIGLPFAFFIQVLVTLGGAFFRWAALVLDFGGSLLGGVGLATVSVFSICARLARYLV